MIWVAIAVLSGVALGPAALVAWRGLRLRGRREAELALYRAQLQELDRDLADGRILPAEHGPAVLEVQRRLLAAGAAVDNAAAGARRAPLLLAMGLIPLLAVGLYLHSGSPGLPAEPLQGRILRAENRARDDQAMIDQLKAKIATQDPKGQMAWRGYQLLGRVEAERHNMKAAAEAWGRALAIHFDPVTALEVAEATTEAEGMVSPASAALFRKALAAAPPNAPWRRMAEKRLSQAGQALPASPTPPSR